MKNLYPMQSELDAEGLVRLREAVARLYYAAHWTADRPVDAIKLWEDVRDAAGFPPGESPEQGGKE